MQTVTTAPIAGQKPGTSGLRKKVREFALPNYLENFVQATFDIVPRPHKAVLVLGGDGRFFNRTAIARIIAMAAANGYGKIVVGKGGILSTPAVSHLIWKRGASGGIILSASHNPGGPDEDFGIKYNGPNGGPAPEPLTEAIYQRSLVLDEYRIDRSAVVDIDRLGLQQAGKMIVEVVDPVADYAALMERLFDFQSIRRAREEGLTFAFDAMHAVTGPYAREIFVERLGFPESALRNCEPLEDFGGKHPDPNLVHAADLYDLMMGPDAPDLGAASDGDGDRNLVIGCGCYVTPSDCLAVLAANAHCAPAYRTGIRGVARSMPTSAAADLVARSLGVMSYETPTGWKYFGNLLDAGKVTICGEESAGAGSDHVREKDGIWAILLWLSILAERRMSVAAIMHDHWLLYGRHYYARHDYENIPAHQASALFERLSGSLQGLPGSTVNDMTIIGADCFDYHDPVDGSLTTGQGVRIFGSQGQRIVYRLSGTGTGAATLRVYLEHYVGSAGNLAASADDMLASLADAARQLAQIGELLGRDQPDVVT